MKHHLAIKNIKVNLAFATTWMELAQMVLSKNKSEERQTLDYITHVEYRKQSKGTDYKQAHENLAAELSYRKGERGAGLNRL